MLMFGVNNIFFPKIAIYAPILGLILNIFKVEIIKLSMSKEECFYQLHYGEHMLVLPNVWDPLGSKLLQSLGYKAVATASASIALTNGFPDGQKVPFKDVLLILSKIVNSVSIPVSADIEAGYASSDIALNENIKQLIDTGISGINFEDSNHYGLDLVPIKVQCKRIEIIKEEAVKKGKHLFINARTDVNLRSPLLSPKEKLEEIILRGKAYKAAGADGFYPMVIKEKNDIEAVIDEVKIPINILLIPGIPEMKVLQKMGLARLSLGPGLLKIAMNAMKNISDKLLRLEGLSDLTENPITSDYLHDLVASKE